MKKILYIFCALAALCSCSKEPVAEQGTKSLFTFELDAQARTLEVTNSITPTRYVMEVWNEDGTPYNCFGDSNHSEQSSSKFAVTLNTSKNYICLFWADDNADNSSGIYNAESLQAVKLNDGKEAAEAFCANVAVSGKTSGKLEIKLRRAVAQISLFETSTVAKNVNIEVAYSQYTQLNLMTGAVAAEPVARAVTVNNGETIAGELGTFLTLAPVSLPTESEPDFLLGDFTLTLANSDKVTLTNVPLHANWITKISGKYSGDVKTFKVSAEDATYVVPEKKMLTINGVKFDFALVKAGTFQAGSPTTEVGRASSTERQHWVKLTKDYYMATTELTERQWKAIMGVVNSPTSDGLDWPVYRVPYEVITMPFNGFMAVLNRMNIGTFRIPTEAEWEYAARGGHKIPEVGYMNYSGVHSANNLPAELEAYVWASVSTTDKRATRQQVASLLPNALGLYDMSGNVYEWCSDLFAADYYKDIPNSEANPVVDPLGPAAPDEVGKPYTARGGRFNDEYKVSRCASRRSLSANENSCGFRLLMEL